MAAYRTSRHDATGYSPNMLIMGRDTRMRVDIVYGTPDELNATSYDGYAGELPERLVTAYDEVRRELRRTAERNKRYYYVTVKPHRYVAGDRYIITTQGSDPANRTNGRESTVDRTWWLTRHRRLTWKSSDLSKPKHLPSTLTKSSRTRENRRSLG